VWGNHNLYDYAVNIPNTDGCIANMERDAIVEVPAVLGKHGIKGIAVGNLPAVAASFCNEQKTIVDYAVKGMVEGDYSSSLQALALDPMVDDLSVARGLLDDGLKQYRKYLPQFE
jgi:alpha-galactosidase/6-phospho-beta-glucosidase family protein